MQCICSIPRDYGCEQCQASLTLIDGMFKSILSLDEFSDIAEEDLFFDLKRESVSGRQSRMILSRSLNTPLFKPEDTPMDFTNLMYGYCFEQVTWDSRMKRKLGIEPEEQIKLFKAQLGYWYEANTYQFVRYSWHLAWFLSKECLRWVKYDLWKSYVNGVWAVCIYQNSVNKMREFESHQDNPEQVEMALEKTYHSRLDSVLVPTFQHIKKIMTEDFKGDLRILHYLAENGIDHDLLLEFTLIHEWCRNPK